MKYRDEIAEMRANAERYRARGFPNTAAHLLAKTEKIEAAVRAAGIWSKKMGRYNLIGKLAVDPVTVDDLIRHGCEAEEAVARLAS